MKRKVIAITGGIGSGKSTVTQILQQQGYKVVFCDVLARQAGESRQVVDSAKKLLGESYVKNGKLDRKAIRRPLQELFVVVLRKGEKSFAK